MKREHLLRGTKYKFPAVGVSGRQEPLGVDAHTLQRLVCDTRPGQARPGDSPWADPAARERLTSSKDAVGLGAK